VGIREKINENPKPYIIGASVVIVLALVVIIWSMVGGGGPAAGDSGKAYFSEDDGASTFEAGYEKLGDPNFKGPNGKEAVLARMYQYPGEKPFVAYLESYTPAGKEKLTEYYKDPKNKGTPPPDAQVELERLIKKPGAGNWLKYGDAGEVLTLQPKNGVMPTAVMPK